MCREALRAEMGLAPGPGPIIGMVTRLAAQKGLDLTLDALAGILADGARLVLLGSGEAPLEEAFTAAARTYPGRIAVRIGYNDELARRIFAGADCFLMPSRYEPCGLSQLIALRYGAVPVVRRTGGLADTVHEVQPARRDGDRLPLRRLLGGRAGGGGAPGRHRPRGSGALERHRPQRHGRGLFLGRLGPRVLTLYRKVIKARASRERGSKP